MTKITTLFLFFSLLSASALGVEPPQAAAQRSEGFKMIVNNANTTTSVNRQFLADAYLKKVTRWPNGKSIQPIDGKPSSQTRVFFSASVMKKPVPAVRNYWTQMIFGGRNIPPPEAPSEEAIIAYVAKRVGAVGYISVYAEPKSVKVIAVK
jgi:ABC-type phosphate transport system substrate-binding protein